MSEDATRMQTVGVAANCPGSTPDWWIDIRPLRDVLRGMGITGLRVDVVGAVVSDEDWCGGYLTEDEAHGNVIVYTHIVLLDRHQDADSAGETLWHELVHAWQAQHLFGGDGDALAAEVDGPDAVLEQIARACESLHYEQPLVHPTDNARTEEHP